MCTFLTVGVDAKRAATLESALIAAKLQVDRRTNPNVARLFPAGDALLLVTHGGCSCDLALADAHGEAEARAKAEAKLRKKGYSAAKIARALASKPQRSRPIAEALQRVVSAHAPVRAYFHQVHGDPQTEAVPARATLLSF